MLDMPKPQFLAVNGIRLAYYEAGPQGGSRAAARALPRLAGARLFVAPPDLGAERSGLPGHRARHARLWPQSRARSCGSLRLSHITGDLAGLVDHLGVEKAIFVGHDWGGAAVWRMAQEHPEKVAGVIGLNTPHPARAPGNPIDIFRKRLGDDFYMVEFQRPEREADRIFADNIEKFFAFFFRGPPLGGSGAGKPNLAFHKIVPAYDALRDTRPKFLSEEEIAVYVETYRRTGFTGGINWYRNIERNWRRAEELDPRITVPCLMIMAEGDVVLPPSAADGMEARMPDLEKHLIRDCGHWTMQEKPEEVNAAMIDWLRRRFG